jgi:DNA-binding response OmpR family regulator
MRLLVVEDELRIVEILTSALRKAGFTVDAATTSADAREALATIPYDAAILDLGLPDGDGLAVLAEARGSGNKTPILLLTARDAVEDRVGGLDAGADDYLVKPFATSELVARIKALLRRPGGALGTILKAGNITFDTLGRDAKVGDTAVALPRREIAILEHLMRRLGRVVPPGGKTLRLRGGARVERDSGACPSPSAQIGGDERDSRDPYRAGDRLPARREKMISLLRPRSLQLYLALRLAALFLAATGAAVAALGVSDLCDRRLAE